MSTLRVPFAGTWDIFYTSDWSAGAALDVRVPADETVEVRLAPHASETIQFRLDGDLPESWARDMFTGIELRSRGHKDALRYPGRDDSAAGLTSK